MQIIILHIYALSDLCICTNAQYFYMYPMNYH